MLALTTGNAAPPLPVWVLVLELEGVALGDPAGSRDTRLPRGWSPELKRSSSTGVGHSNQCSIVKAFSLDLSKTGVREENKIQTNNKTKPRTPNNHQGKSKA